jgi:crossover junction endodeoxyribonuclease RuvC
MKIIGIDPGLNRTGWGVVLSKGYDIGLLSSGVINIKADYPLPVRLKLLSEKISEVISLYAPEAAAVEEIFVNTNNASSLKLAYARGVALFTLANCEISVAEYSPTQVKKALTGNGRADKEQVMAMVKRIIPAFSGVSKDASDALAVAICHAFFYKAS